MRAREILENVAAATSSSGSIATIAQPLSMVARNGGSMLSGKYTTDLTPNTPKEYKRNKNARGQFKNSIGN
jgi:hypothetical protein